MYNLIKKGDTVRLNNDMWADIDRTFLVQKAIYRLGSTAVELTFKGGERRVVPYHQVEVVNVSI